jgi:hypothetical protein
VITLTWEAPEVAHRIERQRRLGQKEHGQGPLVELGKGAKLRHSGLGLAPLPSLDSLHGHVSATGRLVKRHADAFSCPTQHFWRHGS